MANEAIKLSEFVGDAISEIVSGIDYAQGEIADTGANVNPPLRLAVTELAAAGVQVTDSDDGGYRRMITLDFDIAITATSNKERKSMIGVVSGALGAGMQEKRGGESGSNHRLMFSVPIALPEYKEGNAVGGRAVHKL